MRPGRQLRSILRRRRTPICGGTVPPPEGEISGYKQVKRNRGLFRAFLLFRQPVGVASKTFRCDIRNMVLVSHDRFVAIDSLSLSKGRWRGLRKGASPFLSHPDANVTPRAVIDDLRGSSLVENSPAKVVGSVPLRIPARDSRIDPHLAQCPELVAESLIGMLSIRSVEDPSRAPGRHPQAGPVDTGTPLDQVPSIRAAR